MRQRILAHLDCSGEDNDFLTNIDKVKVLPFSQQQQIILSMALRYTIKYTDCKIRIVYKIKMYFSKKKLLKATKSMETG